MSPFRNLCVATWVLALSNLSPLAAANEYQGLRRLNTTETTAPVTSVPTLAPVTPAPTKSPTMNPTASPTDSPSEAPSMNPSNRPLTAVPSAKPSSSPTMSQAPTLTPSSTPTSAPTGSPLTLIAKGLEQTLVNLTSCEKECQETWIAQLVTSTNDFYSNSSTLVIQGNSAVINDVDVVDGGRRRLQESGLVFNYDHTFIIGAPTDGSDVKATDLAEAPFADEADREKFLQELKLNKGFEDLAGVTAIDIPDTASPTDAPTDPPTMMPTEKDDSVADKEVFYEEWGLTQGAFIGICAGAGVFILACLGCFCMSKSKRDEGYQGQEPPDVLKVPSGGGDVSTLGGPQNKGLYGDQSVATVDYDYSKAYGGGGDASLSEAGGTYGSNTQGLLDPANAAATGGALGGFEDAYKNSGNVKEELIHIFAPPGKLGVVIDTPDDGAPVVHAVKDSSVIADKIQVGDKLVAVDDEDVRTMTAIKVSKLISRKSANPSRKLSIIRTTVIE